VRVFKGIALVAVGLLLAVALPSCGGGGGGGGGGITNSSHTPTRSIITQQGWTLEVEQYHGFELTFTVTGSGAGTATMDATVEWTFASNDIDIYLTTTACTAEAFASLSCSYVAKADGLSKPERITFTLTAAGTYRLWIVNFGPGRESGTLEVGLTQ
jgi:hypothetical protein